MNEDNKELGFQVTYLAIPHEAGKVMCLIPQTNLSDIELCFAFTHISFLEHMGKKGLVPFPAGDISDLINALKENIPKEAERMWVPQKNKDNMEGMSILHVIDKEVAFEMFCQTSLPFQLAKSTAVIMCAKEK